MSAGPGRALRCRYGRDGSLAAFVERRRRSQKRRKRLLSPHERRSNRKAWMIHLEEAAMRMLRWLILGSAAILAIASATAQTYDPSHPVCLQRWEWGGSTYFECAYTSWDQCRASAIGLSAMCVENPYWQQPQARRSGGRLRSSTPY
ncbi:MULTISPECIES: DUF3551 domain-containing protein [Bradyrhizobium]|uniref:DUF3551 domain-containing protein n=2 Tax=Bradyrhizobium TaxID=374 RepID=UPI0028167959|nr:MULTISPECIES: DUF3551 domain-containing protein [Bradyrhizobium]